MSTEPSPKTGAAAVASTTTLLRRYFIKPGHWDEFLDIWSRIVVVRKRYGFKVLFALADKERNVFTWAISHEEDIDTVAARYYADPERKALEVVELHVASWEVTNVEPVQIP